MVRRRKPQRQHATQRTRRRFAAVPAVVVTVLLAMLAVGAGLAGQQPTPTDTAPVTAEPTFVALPSAAGTPIAIPSPTTLHRFADKDESTFIASCVADAPADSVPAPVAQAFCVCTLNAYETMYPSYDALRAALASGALSEQTRSDVSDRCVRSILGG